ncbi:COG1470 family protein [Streptomyces hokutonensis]|uniref:COG1470 family protein n=1 Tax=Streptomyces hokutonensis TaxID=1306990 RepID=UPI0033D6B608
MLSTARVLCLSLLAVLTAAPTATATDGWSLAPAGGGRPACYAEGEPGTTLQDTVSVTNPTTRPVTVRLRGTGVPITFAATAVRVPARTRADIPFTVTVPGTAAPGDRTGTIAARDTDGREATVRLQLHVNGPELSALTVEHLAVHGDRITYDLVNRGTTPLTPNLAVHATGLLGTHLDRAPRTLPVQLPPGRRLKLTEPWHHPALDAVDVRLTVTAPGGAHATAETSARFVPWGAAAGTAGALTAGGALFLVRLRRRRRRRDDDGRAAEPPCTEAELTGAVM